jgi:hypothetical protein
MLLLRQRSLQGILRSSNSIQLMFSVGKGFEHRSNPLDFVSSFLCHIGLGYICLED